MPKKPSPREERISVRIPINKFPRLKYRLTRAAKVANVDESVLVLAAIDGICSFVEKYGEVSFPVRVTLRSLDETISKIGKKMGLLAALMGCLPLLA